MCTPRTPHLLSSYLASRELSCHASSQHLDKYQPSVLVWFHGGGLSTGQGILYGPHFFIETEIIVITVNYRLGPWGSLSLDTPTISGNQVGNEAGAKL